MTASINQAEAAHHLDERDGTRSRIVVVQGPTAVGKSALGIALAIEFAGEIVNADSRSLYRGFDIGVAKPDPVERRGVPHHLIDILPPDGAMSLVRYQDLAMTAIAGVLGRVRLPLLIGGTPLYINAVVEGWQIPRVPANPTLRCALEAEARQRGVGSLVDRLHAVDPIAAARCAANVRRIIRAIEVYEATGIPMSAQEGKGPRPFDALEIALTMPREALYQAVDKRIDDQIERGLVAEVRGLVESGIPDSAPAMSSLGYRQLLHYLSGECELEQAIERIRFDTRRYVRHQETWLRRNTRLIWFDVTKAGWTDEVRSHVTAFLTSPVSPAPGV